jgi:hypothetical protein
MAVFGWIKMDCWPKLWTLSGASEGRRGPGRSGLASPGPPGRESKRSSDLEKAQRAIAAVPSAHVLLALCVTVTHRSRSRQPRRCIAAL